MKAIDLHGACITGIRARLDKSIGFSVTTPELPLAARSAFFELQGCNVRLMIQPVDSDVEDTETVGVEKEAKSKSQRLRAALYRLWELTTDRSEPFAKYYDTKMELLIEAMINKLPKGMK